MEDARRYALQPESDALEGIAVIRSATVSLSRVRGYFAVEYEIPGGSPSETVDFRVLDADGVPLTIGMGWTGSGGSECAQQYVFQAVTEMPEQLTLEALDQSGRTLALCPCRVERIP